MSDKQRELFIRLTVAIVWLGPLVWLMVKYGEADSQPLPFRVWAIVLSWTVLPHTIIFGDAAIKHVRAKSRKQVQYFD